MAQSNIIYSQFDWEGLTRRQQIGLMDEYYTDLNLYETTRVLKHYLGVWSEDLRPLRTPVHRSVEFFTSKVAMGEPTISAYNKNQALADAIAQVMDWSNFQIQKPLQIRTMAKYGDVFRKAVSENGKVWHEMVETSDVTDYTADPRGFLTEIRLDTPIKDGGIQKTRTEFWTVNDAVPYMAVWEHRLSEDSALEQINQMSDPIMYVPLSQFGIDFIPFVRSPFSDGGKKWGMNCVEHALLKVDEANRMATRLHQTLFRYNKPTWLVSANQVSPDGTPVAPPKLKKGTNSDKTDAEMRDDSILYLPGQSTVNSLIPDVRYADALAILLSQEKELEKDLPELLYYSLPERADMSGKALRTLLGAAIDRGNQAQANYVEGTVRLNQMCITIGEFQGIFPTLGSFDSGQLGHSIRFQDPFPVDISEKATALQTLVGALGSTNLQLAMQLSGFSEEEISKVVIPEPVVVDTGSTP